MVDEEILQFCEGSFLEDAPVVHVSSTTGEGLDEVREQLDRFVTSHDFREAFGPFRMPVDRSFAMKGFGAVVTGTSISGRTSIGGELRLYPGDLVTKVRGIQVHSKSVEEVEAGHRTAINLQGIDTADIARGMVIAPPGVLEPSYMLDCRLLYLGSNAKPLKHRARIRVHIGTSEVIGRVSLLDRDSLKPGDELVVQLLLEKKVAVWPGDRYVIRSYSPVATIGGGTILGNLPFRKRKRLSETDREYNRTLHKSLVKGSMEEKILFFLRESGEVGLTADDLGIRLGLFGKHLKKALNDPLSTRKMAVVDSPSQRYVITDIAEEIKAAVIARLEEYHRQNPLQNGLAKEELRSAVGRRADIKVFNYCLNELLRKSMVVLEDSVIRMADHQVALKADEQKLQSELVAWYREKGLSTPTLKETMSRFADYPDSLVKEVLGLLLREGELVKISETLYYSQQVIDPLIESVKKAIEKEGEIDAPRFKALTGLTRKFSIPILEYLDRIKVTMRIGDKRILRKKG
jgi:selenocysteine-specific elongation factor